MLTVSVLGDLQLELDGKRLAPPARQSGRLLLGYLALRRGMHARGDLAELIWPEVLQSSARASLRSAIAAVRRTLGDDADRYLLRVGDTLGLDAAVSIDAERFDALVAAGDLARALELSRGPLLQGLDAEWVRQARAEHVDRISDLLAALADEAERGGDIAAAVRYTRRQVALSPLAEPPNRALIRRLAAAGDRASAVAVYGNLAERFRRELRTVPSPQTRRLLDEVRTGRSTASPLPLPAPLELIAREPFVDRTRELERLAAALAGDVRGVVVAGEPGVGKSALVARFASTAASSATVLLGRCRSAASMALEPFAEALRPYASGAPAELPVAAGELSGLIPDLADRLGAPLPSDLLDDGGRVSRAILETLVAASRSGPLVLVLEDLHEADSATLELVEEIVRRPDRAPLLLVATLRDTELRHSSRLAQLTRRVRALPNTTYIALEGLDPVSVAQLAATVTGNEIAPADARRLHTRTNGNPFFATHLLEGGDPFSGSALPERVQDLVWDEVARLSADAQACLAVAATLGVEFDLATVTAVAGYGDDRTLDALDEAVLAHTARELPGAVGRYAFRHQLIRDTIYASQTATRRAHLHRRVAAVLGSEDAGSRKVVDHLRRALELVPPAELAEQLTLAARASEARRTYADAASLYADAAALVTDGARRSELLIALGHARRRAGASEEVTATFLDAAAAGRAAGRADLVVAAALGVCATPYFAGDRPVDRGVVALLEEALETAPAPSVRARLLARLAGELTYDAARGRPDDIAREAVSLARQAGEPEALAAALDVAHLAFRGSGAPERRRELARAARASGPSETLVAAYVHETVAQVELGELGALEANADALARLADELRQPAFVWWSGLWRATAAIVRGALDDARGLVQAAHAAGHAAFGESAELELRAQLAWIRIELGQLSELAGAIGSLESAFSALPVWGSLRARVLAETDASGQTEALVDTALAALEWDTNWLVSAWLVTETLVRTRDVEHAERLRTALAPRAEHWAVSARGTVCFGPVAGALALLCAVEARAEEAARYYELAQRRCKATGARLAAERIAREYRRASADA